MTPHGWSVTTESGHEAVLRDHGAASHYAEKNHGTIETLITETDMRALIAALFLALSACAVTPIDLQDWPTRYRAEIGGVTKAYIGASVALAIGLLTPDEAAKVLEETDRVLGKLERIWPLQPPVPGSDELVAAKNTARAALVQALLK